MKYKRPLKMQITGTHINYYFICKRKLWLFANNIHMEHVSEIVYAGKLIHEESYPQRSAKYEEIEIGGIKVDFFDSKNKVIHEVKKSDKVKETHIWQIKYYLYIFQKVGVDGVTGIIEYPKLRKTEEILLSLRDVEEIKLIEEEINKIVKGKTPELKKMRIRKKCAYYDFCYVGEEG